MDTRPERQQNKWRPLMKGACQFISSEKKRRWMVLLLVSSIKLPSSLILSHQIRFAISPPASNEHKSSLDLRIIEILFKKHKWFMTGAGKNKLWSSIVGPRVGWKRQLWNEMRFCCFFPCRTNYIIDALSKKVCRRWKSFLQNEAQLYTNRFVLLNIFKRYNMRKAKCKIMAPMYASCRNNGVVTATLQL